MSIKVTSEAPLELFSKNSFPLVFKALAGLAFIVFLFSLPFILAQAEPLWLKAFLLVFLATFGGFVVYLSFDERLRIDNDQLVLSREVLGLRYLKKTYLIAHIHRLHVYPKMNQRTIFDPQGLFSDNLRLQDLGGSVVFEYGPLYRSVLMFRGLDESEASHVVSILQLHIAH
ncbi:hypothetical protein [Aliagarivorans taiwanensis]|uniref:hypothetical protein n=1 Tax=Aliagarivorans taiwanensis TaxID=561966 RepID=UPI00047B4EAB|nr:hypothetical protein [Aliagarivorans taiwanensis]